jgi:Lectin C-type domain
MCFRPLPRSWPVAGLLVFTGACSIFTNLSELTRGTASASGTGGTTSTSDTGSTTSASGTGGAKPAGGTGGASTSTASSSSATGAGGADCSGVHEFKDPATSHCYFYDITADDRFSDARTACQAWAPGGDLVVIETTEEASFLFNTVNLEEDTWIGLSDQGSASYQWVTGAPLTYTAWDVGFPSDAGQDQCVSYAASLKWQNRACTSTQLTLCERP